MSDKYKKTFTSSHNARTFDQFLSWQYNMIFQRGPRSIQLIRDEKGECVRYYPDNLYFGQEYFIGPQYFNGDCYGEWSDKIENRHRAPYGIYKFIGLKRDSLPGSNYKIGLELVFESDDGKRIFVLPRTVVLSKNRLLQHQAQNGFLLPSYIKESWPDAIEHRETTRYNDPYMYADIFQKGEFSYARFVIDQIIYVVLMTSAAALVFLSGKASAIIFGIPFIIVAAVISFFWYTCTLNDKELKAMKDKKKKRKKN